MNRRVFASRIAEKTGHSAAAIDAILDAAIAVLAGELVRKIQAWLATRPR